MDAALGGGGGTQQWGANCLAVAWLSRDLASRGPGPLGVLRDWGSNQCQAEGSVKVLPITWA